MYRYVYTIAREPGKDEGSEQHTRGHSDAKAPVLPTSEVLPQQIGHRQRPQSASERIGRAYYDAILTSMTKDEGSDKVSCKKVTMDRGSRGGRLKTVVD